MKSSLSRLLLGAVAISPVIASPAVAAPYRFHEDHVLGTSFDMTVVGAKPEEAGAAVFAARQEIDRLDAVLSGWRDDSELAALNRSAGPFAASQELYDVIAACEGWRAACDGAFSARLGAVEALWNDGRVPDAATLADTAHRAEAANVTLDAASRTIDRQGVVFAVDALAKGYIIDAALSAANRAAPSAAGLMVDIGGDLACSGSAPGGGSWRLGVAGGAAGENALPQAEFDISGGAVATSGVGARDRVINGSSYSHLLSPQSGQAASHRLVTVSAPRAADADALATALSVVPPEHGLELLKISSGAAARIVDQEGKVWTSPGWVAAAPPKNPLADYVVQAVRPWPSDFQLSVNYQYSRQLGLYKVPYVAVFVTDPAGKLIRTLIHQGNAPERFLDSNYVWYRAYSVKYPGTTLASLSSVTRPSRQPGNYTLTWDGKDDAGRAVGQGSYLIKIEVSREHGGHNIQSIPVTLGATALTASAPAQAEMGVSTVTYGKPGS